MQKARHKRKVLNNPNKPPVHEQAKIQQKYKNVIPIPARKKDLRKTQKTKLSILKTYVELKIQERKEYISSEGVTTNKLDKYLNETKTQVTIKTQIELNI